MSEEHMRDPAACKGIAILMTMDTFNSSLNDEAVQAMVDRWVKLEPEQVIWEYEMFISLMPNRGIRDALQLRVQINTLAMLGLRAFEATPEELAEFDRCMEWERDGDT